MRLPVTVFTLRAGRAPQRSLRGLPAAELPPVAAVHHEDPLQVAGPEPGDPLAPGQCLLAALAHEGRQRLVGTGRCGRGEWRHGHVQVLRLAPVQGEEYCPGGEDRGDWS